MPFVTRNCPHFCNYGDIKIIESVFGHKEKFNKCSDCDSEGPNLWLCLYPECRWVGCAENNFDHGTMHNNKYPQHCAHMNLATNRIWCYICEKEVIVRHVPSPSVSPSQISGGSYQGDTSLNMDCKIDPDMRLWVDRFYGSNETRPGDSPDTSDSEDCTDFRGRPRGLVGLQNIGNTCYMNSALQALSNVVPLTQFFLDCSNFVLQMARERKPGLSLSYMNLVKDMWNRKTRGYVVPSNILSNIRAVNPMFRGYHQHDTQEFLRCFMDQLHEELKERIDDDKDIYKDILKCLDGQSSDGDDVNNGNDGGDDDDDDDNNDNDNADDDDDDDDNNDTTLNNEDNNINDKNDDDDDQELNDDGSSQSDGEYETCDSGVSEQSSLSDEGERGTKRRYSRLSQTENNSNNNNNSKLRNKFTIRTSKKNNIDDNYSTQRSIQQQGSPTKHNNIRLKKQSKTRSIISDIFDGKLLSSVQCLMCDRVSMRMETFQDLSLPIPSRDHVDMLHQGSLTPQKAGPCSDVVYVTNQSGWITWFYQWMRSWFWGPVVSLPDCLSAFFSADELKGDNMYSCEKCNKLRNGIKYSKVLELPEILCIHLKRFRHELMFSSKIANYVSFPLEELDMKPYLHKDCISNVSTYDLISVICHHGTAGGGHYTCYALNTDINQWFEFDDQCVTQVTADTVKHCEAYVLFYKKSSNYMLKCRDKTVELMELSSREPELIFYVSKQWINRFNTFSEPGPIDNSDFLCPHGGVNPMRSKSIDKLSRPLPQAVWEYLYNTFGGGPACTHLFECPICEDKYETLQKRRQHEMDVFQRFNNTDNPTAIYALAMSWFRQWQIFVKGKDIQPPGPIDNTSIVVNVNGQKMLKPGSDCSQISEEFWHFLLSIYGGGPELMLQPCQRTSSTIQPNNISLHSTSAPNLMEPSLKPNRIEAKLNHKVIITKSTETISQQDSAIESIASDNESLKSQKDSIG
ncbi:hypothetical protein HCN44_001882 [Aphidius gifuensis]|uniref:Ubiquitin carboxyl-terminal hydrolase n=1 Tax=Aphidius gifuensis TaxID=684658 RepID=A0A834Y1N3_APHGI|nr:ubiquitin carboxyl-terminal hydrolase 20 [Aphidius gifuensis]KAF7996250.1 hypothetical protein HCN44_001882 [Aphidius gifuensis]